MRDQVTQSKGAVQRAVLSLVLNAHPDPLTIPAIASEIGQDAEGEHAIRDLVGVGLLECNGITVKPTAAAIHFDSLGL